ncbi:MAG: hypothetical protein SGI88_00900 [Candidatus Hydrogenedentes bacterium]|nr:hypothetical protein [Candidatus Hydrogenedentota bacterium]
MSAPLSLQAGATTCFIEINELAKSAYSHALGGSALPKKSGADTPHSKALRAGSFAKEFSGNLAETPHRSSLTSNKRLDVVK